MSCSQRLMHQRTRTHRRPWPSSDATSPLARVRHDMTPVAGVVEQDDVGDLS